MSRTSRVSRHIGIWVLFGPQYEAVIFFSKFAIKRSLNGGYFFSPFCTYNDYLLSTYVKMQLNARVYQNCACLIISALILTHFIKVKYQCVLYVGLLVLHCSMQYFCVALCIMLNPVVSCTRLLFYSSYACLMLNCGFNTFL